MSVRATFRSKISVCHRIKVGSRVGIFILDEGYSLLLTFFKHGNHDASTETNRRTGTGCPYHIFTAVKYSYTVSNLTTVVCCRYLSHDDQSDV